MRTLTAIAPAYWASLLINGDASGMEEHEVEAAEAWLVREGLPSPVSCEPAGFYSFHDALPEYPYAAECEFYVFLIPNKPE
jgi:hypothetical protein